MNTSKAKEQILNFVVLGLFLLSTIGVQAESLTAEKVLSKYKKAMTQLEDVKAKAQLDLNLVVGFLPYSENLQGRYYYLNPNKHRLEFDDAPSYFDKAPSMFRWKLPSLEKYKVKLKGPFQKEGTKVYELLYLPKNDGSSTQSITCSMSTETWRMVKQETSYRDGGSVALRFQYLADTKLPVLDKVKASVSIPSYSLTGGATITFSKQEINKGLDESIFSEKN